MSEWSIDSWRNRPIFQQPSYDNPAELKSCIEKIKCLPPLVHVNEIRSLRKQLAEVAAGKRFLIQGGDCAERFQDCSNENIEGKLKILLQMSLVLTFGARMPTVRIGRLAGQYGKPRSSPTDVMPDGTSVPSFKGDNINGFEKTPEARRHDPQRLVLAHYHSACTLNYIRALIKGGIADLHNSYAWDLTTFRDPSKRSRYQDVANRICDSLDFMSSIGISPHLEQVKEVDFFSSHEALVLEYEAACTAFIQSDASFARVPSSPTTKSSASASSPTSTTATTTATSTSRSVTPPIAPEGEYYDLSAHFLWIGERTRQLDGAHVEFFRGLKNPIGVKVGPSMKPDELIALIKALDPNNEPGRLTLITRLGASKVASTLPPLVHAVQNEGLAVVWCCDPMHGNTYSTGDGIKTRAFEDILAELQSTFEVHAAEGSHLGGIHFELTGEHVTECVGGPENLDDKDLHLRYTTYCDPRLNYAQSLNMSFLIADLLKDTRS